MGLLNRIFGTESQDAGGPRRSGPVGTDAYALERYRYMLQTAPPETIEQAHAEAFEKLTPEQRQQVLAELAQAAPVSERRSIEGVSRDDARGLARVATRAEIRQPGIMERTLGAAPGMGSRGTGSQGMGSQGMGSQGMGFGANLLGSFAAAFAGSMVANAFFDALGGFDGFGEAEPGAHEASGADDASGAADDGDTLAGVGDQDGDFDGGGFDGGDFDV
jgi:hypothetical protein